MLCPNISVREGCSAVSLHIAYIIFEPEYLTIYFKLAVHSMFHTVYCMFAFHSGNICERPHDVVLWFCESSKAKDAAYFL